MKFQNELKCEVKYERIYLVFYLSKKVIDTTEKSTRGLAFSRRLTPTNTIAVAMLSNYCLNQVYLEAKVRKSYKKDPLGGTSSMVFFFRSPQCA